MSKFQSMKKQITIFILLILPFRSFSQDGIVKLTTPCNEEYTQNFHGRWLDAGAGLDPNLKISKQQQQEIFNRVNKIHQFVFDIYPSPQGFDAGHDWHTSHEQFAYQVKLEHLANGNTAESRINGVPTILYWYEAYFGRYSCVYNDNHKMLRGLPSDDVEGFSVNANKLTLLEEGAPYEMNVDGREIQMMPVIKARWKGYTFYTPETGSRKTMVLLHRDGMLPYIPVTRKQYLDLSISYLDKMFDKLIADIDKDAKTFIDAGMADPQTLKENKEKYQKQKKDVLKHYNHELAATTAAGLFDVPAVIPLAICDPDVTRAIFTTEAAGGRLLVTENPGYIRRDLPKYIPQLLVLTFEEASWTPSQKKDPLKLVE